MDAGASSHFTRYKHKLTDYVAIEPINVRAANGETFQAIGRGNLLLKMPLG
ncbi:hypothetical protein DENSPDRAFT_784538, partial [Dentipellis sp. KUC8613]